MKKKKWICTECVGRECKHVGSKPRICRTQIDIKPVWREKNDKPKWVCTGCIVNSSEDCHSFSLSKPNLCLVSQDNSNVNWRSVE